MMATTDDCECVIVGAGIVGLATAWQLIQKRPQTRLIVIEKENAICRHQSGANSGVLHSGIYYQPGSDKAILCRQGLLEMKAFARQHTIAYQDIGKLIIATNRQQDNGLRALFARAQANGIEQVELLDAAGTRAIEPDAYPGASVFLPETGIIDYAAVCQKLKELLEAKGVLFCFGRCLTKITRHSDSLTLNFSMQTPLKCRFLISCAGLYADRVAALDGLHSDLRIIPFRGEYTELTAQSSRKIGHLLYPVPNPNLPFLGIHVTPMIDGRVTFGPNAVLAYAREGYRKSTFSMADMRELLASSHFYRLAWRYPRVGLYEMARSFSTHLYVQSVRHLLPGIKRCEMVTSKSGVRAQAVSSKGQLIHDFVTAKQPRTYHVLNAPSPAATASLAIGRKVADEALAHFHLAL